MADLKVAGAALGGFAGVALGAAGAHLAQADPHLVETASHYLLLHSAVLLGIAVLARQRPSRLLEAAGVLFFAGMVLFGGGLTLFAISGNQIGHLSTPVGGTTLLLGWLVLGLYGLLARTEG